MIVLDVQQGTPEWLEARLGVPTASEFDKILTPTGKVSTQAEAYQNRLLAEIITNKPVQTFEKTAWMDRGNELESEAIKFYELQNDIGTLKVGFCLDDTRSYGASPDRLIGEDGILEMKVPAPHTHVEYLLSGEMDKGYYPQVQGQLMVTNRKWCDWMSYNPEMPPVVIRVERDESYISLLRAQLEVFNRKLSEKKESLKSKGVL